MIEEIGDSVRYLHAARDIFRSAGEPFAVHLTSMAICEAERLLQREYSKLATQQQQTAPSLPEPSNVRHVRPAAKKLSSIEI